MLVGGREYRNSMFNHQAHAVRKHVQRLLPLPSPPSPFGTPDQPPLIVKFDRFDRGQDLHGAEVEPPVFFALGSHASGWFQQRVVSHPTFSCQVKHGAEKLPYYTVDLHMEYAMACRKRSRKERDEEARIVWWGSNSVSHRLR